jgi:hypothetical protein
MRTRPDSCAAPVPAAPRYDSGRGSTRPTRHRSGSAGVQVVLRQNVMQRATPDDIAESVRARLWNAKIESLRITEGRTRPGRLRTCPAGAGFGAMKQSLRNLAPGGGWSECGSRRRSAGGMPTGVPWSVKRAGFLPGHQVPKPEREFLRLAAQLHDHAHRAHAGRTPKKSPAQGVAFKSSFLKALKDV